MDRTAVIDIITTGTIPFNPGVFTSSQSKLFSESKDPTSKYLMETRSQYIDLSRFYGSDYFLSRIGYNESKDWNMARRLGDAYYETKYMNSLLLETLGTRFINGKADTELMKEMLDNAVTTSGVTGNHQCFYIMLHQKINNLGAEGFDSVARFHPVGHAGGVAKVNDVFIGQPLH